MTLVLMVVTADSCEMVVEGNRRLSRITNRDPWSVAGCFGQALDYLSHASPKAKRAVDTHRPSCLVSRASAQPLFLFHIEICCVM